MSIDLSSAVLDTLSVPEMVRLLEQLWQSLCSQPADVASPQWHSEVLQDRSQRLADGRATRIPWVEAGLWLQQLGG